MKLSEAVSSGCHLWPQRGSVHYYVSDRKTGFNKCNFIQRRFDGLKAQQCMPVFLML